MKISDYRDTFELGCQLEEVLWFYSVLAASGSVDALHGFFLPLNGYYKERIRTLTYKEFSEFLKDYDKISVSGKLKGKKAVEKLKAELESSSKKYGSMVKLSEIGEGVGVSHGRYVDGDESGKPIKEEKDVSIVDQGIYVGEETTESFVDHGRYVEDYKSAEYEEPFEFANDEGAEGYEDEEGFEFEDDDESFEFADEDDDSFEFEEDEEPFEFEDDESQSDYVDDEDESFEFEDDDEPFEFEEDNVSQEIEDNEEDFEFEDDDEPFEFEEDTESSGSTDEDDFEFEEDEEDSGFVDDDDEPFEFEEDDDSQSGGSEFSDEDDEPFEFEEDDESENEEPFEFEEDENSESTTESITGGTQGVQESTEQQIVSSVPQKDLSDSIQDFTNGFLTSVKKAAIKGFKKLEK